MLKCFELNTHVPDYCCVASNTQIRFHLAKSSGKYTGKYISLADNPGMDLRKLYQSIIKIYRFIWPGENGLTPEICFSCTLMQRKLYLTLSCCSVQTVHLLRILNTLHVFLLLPDGNHLFTKLNAGTQNNVEVLKNTYCAYTKTD